MAKLATANNDFGVEFANAACVSNLKLTAMTSNAKRRSCGPIMSAPPYAALPVSLACRVIRSLRGSKKAKALPPLEQGLLRFQDGDELELDEMWSFVLQRKNKVWLWLALCRRTRQIVAYALGCRGEATCRLLWSRIPMRYRHSFCYSDFWAAYAQVVPPEQHERSEKKGKTNHIERWNNTLRQRVGRFVRRTLSFSKTDEMHEIAVRLFIHRYNLQRLITLG